MIALPSGSCTGFSVCMNTHFRCKRPWPPREDGFWGRRPLGNYDWKWKYRTTPITPTTPSIAVQMSGCRRHAAVSPWLVGRDDRGAPPVSSGGNVSRKPVAAGTAWLSSAAGGGAGGSLEQDRQAGADLRLDCFDRCYGTAHRFRRAHHLPATGVVRLRGAARDAAWHGGAEAGDPAIALPLRDHPDRGLRSGPRAKESQPPDRRGHSGDRGAALVLPNAAQPAWDRFEIDAVFQRERAHPRRQRAVVRRGALTRGGTRQARR